MTDYQGTKRGGFIYTATLLLFLAISLTGRMILSALKCSDTVFYAVSSLFSVTAFALAVFLYVKKGGKSLLLSKFSPIYAVPAFLLAIGMFLGLGFVNILVADGVKSLGGVVNEVQIPLDTPFRYVLFIVVLCVFPAVAEELFFRGVLDNCMSGVKKAAGVITVALCFALYHGNVAQLCYQFIYGLGLGFLTLKAQSVIPAIIAHFINNFSVLTFEYFNIGIDLFNPFIIAIGISLIILFAAFLVFYKKGAQKTGEATENVKGFYIPFGVIGIAVSVIIIILSVLPIS